MDMDGRQNEIIAATKGVVLFEGRFLLIRRSNYDQGAEGMWECPGGRLQFGETLVDCLRREVMEETGLSVSVSRLLYASDFWTNPRRQVVLLCYLCRAESAEVVLSNEHTEYIWADEGAARGLLPQSIQDDWERNGVWGILREAL